MRYLAAAIFFVGFLAQAARAQTVNDATLAVDHIIGNLDTPSGMAFMPDGRAL